MKLEVSVENIKCNGCATRITNKVNSISQVSETSVDVSNGIVSFLTEDNNSKDAVLTVLKSMGYPQIGEGTKIDNAKSYVSCMIGRFEK